MSEVEVEKNNLVSHVTESYKQVAQVLLVNLQVELDQTLNAANAADDTDPQEDLSVSPNDYQDGVTKEEGKILGYSEDTTKIANSGLDSAKEFKELRDELLDKLETKLTEFTNDFDNVETAADVRALFTPLQEKHTEFLLYVQENLGTTTNPDEFNRIAEEKLNAIFDGAITDRKALPTDAPTEGINSEATAKALNAATISPIAQQALGRSVKANIVNGVAGFSRIAGSDDTDVEGVGADVAASMVGMVEGTANTAVSLFNEASTGKNPLLNVGSGLAVFAGGAFIATMVGGWFQNKEGKGMFGSGVKIAGLVAAVWAGLTVMGVLKKKGKQPVTEQSDSLAQGESGTGRNLPTDNPAIDPNASTQTEAGKTPQPLLPVDQIPQDIYDALEDAGAVTPLEQEMRDVFEESGLLETASNERFSSDNVFQIAGINNQSFLPRDLRLSADGTPELSRHTGNVQDIALPAAATIDALNTMNAPEATV